jgi:hypothetical protein
LEATRAIQSERKTAWRSGLQIEAPGAGLPAALGLTGLTLLIVKAPEFFADCDR